MKTDPNKVEAITKMKVPENVKELKTFLGTTNYVAKFIPMLSTLTEKLRILERKDVEWHWNNEQ